MKSFIGLILFLVVFLLVGVATHFAIFGKPGVYIWSLNDQNKITQTRLKVVGPVLAIPPVQEVPKVGQQIEPTPPPVVEEKKAEVTVVETKVVPDPPKDPNVISLFNGKDLGQWESTQFGGEGEVFVNEEGDLEFGAGAIISGVHWKGEVPRTSNFEISLEAMKIDGNDFFCGLTFPVKDSHATFVIGGWGGGIVGISSVDDLDASENETLKIEGYNEGKWYQIKVRVTDDKIQAWIDGTQMVDLELKDRKISLRPGDIELSVPIGIASFQTRSKYRNLVWTNLPKAP